MDSPVADGSEPAEAKAGDSAPGLVEEAPDGSFKPSWRFYLVFVSQCLTAFATALEATITVTALPTVTASIHATNAQYVWIADSFLIASTAVQPAVAQLSDIFGRRNPLLISIAFFILGSGIAGGANSPGMLIAGRTIQGLGAGGSFVLVDVVTSDLVPQRQRGPYLGVMFAMAGLGVTLGPLIGGALADASWRWIYYIMLPIGGIALLAEFFFLRVTYKPSPDWKAALLRVDWIGSAIFIPAMTAIMLGLVLGGTTYPWGSYHIVVPLVLGFLTWIAFHFYEASRFCKEPTMPPRLFTNRTSTSGYIIAFIAAMLLEWIFYFVPVYFQGSRGTSAFESGVNTLPLAIIMLPAAIVAGALMTITGQYKPLHWLGFIFLAVGTGLFSIWGPSTSTAEWACFQVIASLGIGFTIGSVLPAIQATLADTDVASSTGTYSFLRSFGMVWGVVIPSAIFNGQINTRLDQIDSAAVRAALANGGAYGFATSNTIRTYSAEVQAQIRDVYAEALRPVWYAAAAFAALGFFIVFIEKHVTLRTENTTEFGIDEKDQKKKQGKNDVESSPVSAEVSTEK